MSQTLNIHQKINMRQLVKEFPVIAEKEMAQRFRSLKIGETGDLERDMSFRGKLLVNGVMVEIDYYWYGIWTDLGLGKGITAGDVAVVKLIGSGRKRKNWTRKLAAFRHRLGELYTDISAENITQHAMDSYDRRLRFKL